MNSAEIAYLFRHALLRDAAYQLQLPGDRARLHALAFAAIEDLAGGRAPEAAQVDTANPLPFLSHPTDPFARELAEHARLAAPGIDSLSCAHRLYLRRAAEIAERAYEMDASLMLWRAHAETVEGAEKGESLRRAGMVAYHGGRRGASEPLLEQSLALFRELRDRRSEVTVLAGQALLYLSLGRYEIAGRGLEETLAFHRSAGDPRGEAIALANLGTLQLETGLKDCAARSFELAMARFRQVRDRRGEGISHLNRGIIYGLERRFSEAKQCFEEALELFRTLGRRRDEGSTLANFARLCLDSGDPDRAEQLLLRALDIHREVGDRPSEGATLGNLAEVMGRTGRTRLAAAGFERAVAIHREVQDRRFEGYHLCSLSRHLVAEGRCEEARRAWCTGAAILRELGHAQDLADQAAEMREACAAAGVPPMDEAPA